MMPTKESAIREARSWAWQGCLIIALSLLIGEAVFRLPWVAGILAYEYDGKLGWRLAPGQRGCLFMGNLSFLSPTIGINEDGYRNGKLDWNSPKVLCLGSSEAMGMGVEDNEVWTHRMEERLRPLLPGVEVVNAAGPAYGPFHSGVVLERFLARKVPHLVVVRVSLGDRNFQPPSFEELERLRRKSERTQRILAVARYLPFLYNKIQAQMMAIRDVFPKKGNAPATGTRADRADAGISMWNAQREHWRAIADTCTSRSIPALFFVDDPLDTEAGEVLTARIRDNITGPGIAVEHLGSKWFELRATDLLERRREYGARYTLARDPHSNPAKHERVAAFIVEVVTREASVFLFRGNSGKH